jgi:hypothetical protein
MTGSQYRYGKHLGLQRSHGASDQFNVALQAGGCEATVSYAAGKQTAVENPRLLRVKYYLKNR